MISFSSALDHLKGGRKIHRTGWNGKGMFLFLVEGYTFTVDSPALLEIFPEDAEINYRPYIGMKTSQGDIVPWVASQSDLLTDDWFVIEG